MAFKDGFVEIPLEFAGNKGTWRLYWDSYLGRKLVDLHDTAVRILNALFEGRAAVSGSPELSLTAHGTGFEGNLASNTIIDGTVTSFTLEAKYDGGTSKTKITGFEPQDATTFFENMLDLNKDYEYAITLLAGDTVAKVQKGSTGGAFFDTGAGNDTVTGGKGNDIAIKWLAGDLDFDGGKGTDLIQFRAEFGSIWNPLEGLVLDLGTGKGTNPYGAGEITLKNVENVIGTTFADEITGSNKNNIIGDGMFDGGADTIKTLGGDDTVKLTIDSIGIDVDGGDGKDRLVFTLTEADFVIDLQNPDNSSSDWSIRNVETFTVSTIFATGQWTFTFRGSNAGETVNGSSTGFVFPGADATLYGRDYLHGGGGGDALNGLTGNDELHGDAGKDILTGGTGKDLLEGGADADRFRFVAATDSTRAAEGQDTIADFDHSEGDRIDLSRIDANQSKPKNQDFKFIDDGAFSGKAGQVRWLADGDDVRVEADTNGDQQADFVVILTDTEKLVKADFLL